VIDCGIFILRPWRAGDEPSLSRHADDREIWRNLRDRFPHPYTMADAEAWIRLVAEEDRPMNFAIEVDGEAVGGIGLEQGTDIERITAELGYWLGRMFWGRGIVSAAVRGITQYAFSTLGLTRVYALPFARNVASIRVLEKAGYIREGRLRRNALKEGEVLDQVLFAITDQDLAAAGYL
jgi:[ribosomal protein S5]-alanine N-acetyltransferase